MASVLSFTRYDEQIPSQSWCTILEEVVPLASYRIYIYVYYINNGQRSHRAILRINGIQTRIYECPIDETQIFAEVNEPNLFDRLIVEIRAEGYIHQDVLGCPYGYDGCPSISVSLSPTN